MATIQQMLYRNKRLFDNRSINTQIFTLKEKMPFQKIIPELNLEEYASKKGLQLDNTLARSGLFVFKNENDIQAVYDATTQTINSFEKSFVEGV